MALSFTRKVNMSPGQRDTGDVIDAGDVNDLQEALEDISLGTVPIPLAGISGALGEAYDDPSSVLGSLRASADRAEAGTISALAFGAFGSGQAVQEALDAARLQVQNGVSVAVEVPAAKTAFWELDAPLLVYPGTVLRGTNTNWNAHNTGTVFVPSDSFSGGPLVKVVDADGLTADYVHHTRLLHFRVKDGPSHGIQWAAKYAELSLIDGVYANDCGGDGIRVDGGGTPIQVGRVACFGNDGAGLRIKDAAYIVNVEHLSGDDNLDGLLHIENGSPYSLYVVGGIKAERQASGRANTIVKLTNLRGGHVAIAGMSVNHNALLSGSPDPIVTQTSTDTVQTPGTVSIGRCVGNESWRLWGGGYVDSITGLSVSADALTRGGLSTQRHLTVDPMRGGHDDTPLQLTGTVGTSATTWPHGLDYTPTIEAIVPLGDARVWQSSAPDATNIYLQASSSVVCNVSLGRGTRLAAFAVVAQYDTFTDTDGTALTSHTPDTGGSWSASAAWTIQGNKAVPSGTNRTLSRDIGAADQRVRAVVNLGADGTSRDAGLLFRRSDANNYWLVRLTKSAVGTANLQLYSVISSVFTQIETPLVTLAASTNYTLTIEVRGRQLRVLLDSRLVLNEYISTFNLAATGVGVWGNTSAVSVDTFEARTL